jgi:Nuclear pore complex scaffold, nucleoporins 186/192/205
MRVCCRQYEILGSVVPILILASVSDVHCHLYTDKLTQRDVDTSMALRNYYELLSSVLRLLVSVFYSRGQQNEQSQLQMRTFLTENRLNMVGVFKRYNGIGGSVSAESRTPLENVVKSYIALMSMADFVEVSVPSRSGERHANEHSSRIWTVRRTQFPVASHEASRAQWWFGSWHCLCPVKSKAY